MRYVNPTHVMMKCVQSFNDYNVSQVNVCGITNSNSSHCLAKTCFSSCSSYS